MAKVAGGGGGKPKKVPPQRTAGTPLPSPPVGGRAPRVEADISPPKGGRGTGSNSYPRKVAAAQPPKPRRPPDKNFVPTASLDTSQIERRGRGLDYSKQRNPPHPKGPYPSAYPDLGGLKALQKRPRVGGH
jgi:hypothetical protein